MLTGLLRGRALRDPGGVAVTDGEGSLTWRELRDLSDGVGAVLAERGCAPGDAVGIVLPNVPAFIPAFFGVAAAGCVALPLGPHLSDPEVADALAGCGCRAVVTDAPNAARVGRILEERGGGPVVTVTADPSESGGLLSLAAAAAAGGAAGDRTPSPGGADALYQYSSGSTGVAKLVARTHANCVAEAENFVATTGIGPDDAIMVVVPLFHAHGLGNCLLASACGGARLVILTDAQPFVLHRRRTVELMAREGVTVLPGVPLLFEALAAMPRDEGTGGLEGEAPPSGPGSVTAPLGRLRLAFSAGSPLPGATARAFRDRWGVPLRQLYGCTEAGSVTIDLDADPSPERTGVGRPMRGVEVLAVDEKGEPLPPDAVGRVVIRSPALTRGYVGDPETTARSFRHGGFLTGDLGRVDAQGRLHVVGRVRPFIERAGHKVDPREVEAALLEHPEVREAVVLGVRRRGAGANEVDPATSPGDPTSPGDVGPGTGEAVLKAVVVAAGGLTEDELLRHCRARLAGFKVPSVVEIRDALPRDALGKVARRELT